MLLDNKKNGKVGDLLGSTIGQGSKLSIISSSFSIYAYESLKKELGQVDTIRLLLSKISPEMDTGSCSRFSGLNGDKYERRFQNKLNQVGIIRIGSI